MSKKQKEPVTLREYLKACRILEQDTDIAVDGIDVIAYCGTELTEEGEKEFERALNLPVEDGCVVSHDQIDYDLLEDGDSSQEGALDLAWRLLASMAGYCSVDDYEKWFEEA